MKFLFGFAVVLAAASTGFAVPITFTFTGSGWGTIGSTSFDSTPFTITAISDTQLRTFSLAGTTAMNHLSTQINLDGIGVYSFTTSTQTIVDPVNSSVAFSRVAADEVLFGSAFPTPGFSNWDMSSPTSSTNFLYALVNWGNSPVLTS